MLGTILLIIGLFYVLIFFARSAFALILSWIFYSHLDNNQKNLMVWLLLQSLGLGFILWYFLKLYLWKI